VFDRSRLVSAGGDVVASGVDWHPRATTGRGHPLDGSELHL
jgi:hypothetical protein